MLRTQLSALPDSSPPVGADTEELQRMVQRYKRGSAQSNILLQRMAEWYKQGNAQSNMKASVPCGRTAVGIDVDIQQPRRGLHLCECRDVGGTADALVPSRPNAYCLMDVLASCSPAVRSDTDIQQPSRWLHLYEQRDVHSLTERLVPTRFTRSAGSKVVLSRQRHWREEQLECLRRRAKAKLDSSPSGRYEDEQGSGGVAFFRLIGVLSI